MEYCKTSGVPDTAERLKAWHADGKKVLGVICCHLPLELLHALDILPLRLRATGCVDNSKAETWMTSFSCSYARGILQYLMDGVYDVDGVVSSDGCAMATRLFDNYKYIQNREGKDVFTYFLNAPRICDDLSIDFFTSELRILAAELEGFSGNKLTEEKLKHSIALYNEARALTREMYEMRKADKPVLTGEDALKMTLAFADLPVEEYIEQMKAFLAELKTRKPLEGYHARFVVIGSALDDPNYIKVIEDKGGLVVGDVLCYGSRCFHTDCSTEGDPMKALAAYYLERLVCPRMVDSRVELHHEVIKVAKEYNADGVIYEKMQNCEIWGAENFLLNGDLEKAGIPCLVLQREEIMANEGQLAIRAEAFVEMVEKEG